MNVLKRMLVTAVAALAVGIYTPSSVDAAGFVSPPKVVFIVKPVMPVIPQETVVADDMRIRFLIDKKGKVKNVFVERSSGYEPVDEAVKKAVKQWEFKPTIGEDNKPHESIIGMTIMLPVTNK